MKRVTEDHRAHQDQWESQGQEVIQEYQEVLETLACKVHLVLLDREVVLAHLGQRAEGVHRVQMDPWENQVLKASGVKKVTLEKKAGLDSLAKLVFLGKGVFLENLENQVCQEVLERRALWVNQDPKDLLESLGLMESKDLKVHLVQRGRLVLPESRGQRGSLDRPGTRENRDKKASEGLLDLLGKMDLKGKMDLRVKLGTLAQ